ncbi:MAG: RNA-binding protein, partial [Pigeon pea little leaf phytoplasma]|nr:RNA-binding protein [Pigeon pea little leaf phytoplasma]
MESEKVRRRCNWMEVERGSHTIFVDNLPSNITKGMLYKIFGWAGNVVDVYVSRKGRKGTSSPFAFIRYDAKGGAERAIGNLHGVCIGTKRMEVAAARFNRFQNSQPRKVGAGQSNGSDTQELGRRREESDKFDRRQKEGSGQEKHNRVEEGMMEMKEVEVDKS